jgi:uncharacterized protein (DUF1778 family)
MIYRYYEFWRQTGMKDSRLSIRINEDLLDKLRFNAKLNGQTFADFVTNALQIAIGECDNTQTRLSRLETIVCSLNK